MKERPILFSAPMVRAIREDRKTQTRRVVKPSKLPDGNWMVETIGGTHKITHWDNDTAETSILTCPYGQPGDFLWVRETWMPDAPHDGTWAATSFYGCKNSPLSDIPERFRTPAHCLYRASWTGNDLVGWKPSIHMPRWASRITLEITGVRVERLWDISDSDSLAEGIYPTSTGLYPGSPKAVYRKLWESINGPGSWEANPFVWVLEFRRVKP